MLNSPSPSLSKLPVFAATPAPSSAGSASTTQAAENAFARLLDQSRRAESVVAKPPIPTPGPPANVVAPAAPPQRPPAPSAAPAGARQGAANANGASTPSNAARAGDAAATDDARDAGNDTSAQAGSSEESLAASSARLAALAEALAAEREPAAGADEPATDPRSALPPELALLNGFGVPRVPAEARNAGRAEADARAGLEVDAGAPGMARDASGLRGASARGQGQDRRDDGSDQRGSGGSGFGADATAGAAIDGAALGERAGVGAIQSSFESALAKANGAAAPAPSLAPAYERAQEAGRVSVAVPAPVYSPDFAPALAVQVSLLASDGVTRAELHLNPAEMGPVSIEIAIDGTRAHVEFGADLAATRSAIEAGLPELAGALREAGLTLAGGGVSQHSRERQPGAETAAQAGRGGSRAAGDDADAVVAPAPRRNVALGGVDLYA